ncbi:MAG: glycosyltransferase [Cyanobacteria bacterium P01_G01_bin.19]
MSNNSALVDREHTPRILVVSVRGFRFQVANCCYYEFEDLLSSLEGSKLHCPGDENAFPFNSARKIYRIAKYAGLSDPLAAKFAPFPSELVLKQKYDLLFAVLDNPWQMHLLESIKGWRENCHQAACYLTEMWLPDLDNWRLAKEPWNDFDHIFLGLTHCIEGLRKLVKPPITYIPYAVDTLRFSSYPNPPQRSIDVSYVGRRALNVHEALINRSAQDNFFYFYDTVKGKLEIGNPREHRILLANLFQRSRYTINSYAKFDEIAETGGTQEIGSRFFEGAAAGTVMVGMPPSGDLFSHYFDWEDPIIKVDLRSEDVVEAIAELDAQPERLDRISKRNTANCLLKHDWVYRWRDMLDVLGLKPSSQMIAREKYLQELGKSILAEI